MRKNALTSGKVRLPRATSEKKGDKHKQNQMCGKSRGKHLGIKEQAKRGAEGHPGCCEMEVGRSASLPNNGEEEPPSSFKPH